MKKLILIILAIIVFAVLTAVNIDVGIQSAKLKGLSAGATYTPPVVNATDAYLLPLYRLYIPDGEELVMMAKTGWDEMLGVKSVTEQAGVYWNILNRVDDPQWPDTVKEVIIQRNPIQYAGWDSDNPVDDELLDLAKNVVRRWVAEKLGDKNAGRVLPEEYVYFSGDGVRNYFRTCDGEVWKWTLPTPYES